MRLIPMLMLALLMFGFASRPTVSAALTNGSVLYGHMQVTVSDAHSSISPTAPDGSSSLLTKCVSLGILPDVDAKLHWSSARLDTASDSTSIMPRSAEREIFRPPSVPA